MQRSGVYESLVAPWGSFLPTTTILLAEVNVFPSKAATQTRAIGASHCSVYTASWESEYPADMLAWIVTPCLPLPRKPRVPELKLYCALSPGYLAAAILYWMDNTALASCLLSVFLQGCYRISTDIIKLSFSLFIRPLSVLASDASLD